MRLSLKAKLTALITLLVLLVVVVTSTVYISNLTRQALPEVQSQGEYVANEVYAPGAVRRWTGRRMPGGTESTGFSGAAQRACRRACLPTPAWRRPWNRPWGISPLSTTSPSPTPISSSWFTAIPTRSAIIFTPAPHYSQLMQGGDAAATPRGLRPAARSMKSPCRWPSARQPLGDVRVGVSTVLLRR